MPDASPQWMLPGPFLPYRIVLAGDAQAQNTARRVPAETALTQLDNWAAVRGDILQAMELALREPTSSKEPPAPLPCKPGMDLQLKSRLTALLQASRLVVLEAAPAPKAPGTPTRKVTYTFVFQGSGLVLPYVAAIDGVVVETGRLGSIRSNVSFSLDVPVGSTVSVFLNSDAHPDHRLSPVYGVSPRERDVRVTVTEKSGKVEGSTVPSFDDKASKAQNRDVYTAALTGAIWMKVSHRYTEEEAKDCLPATTLAGVREAVLSIYRGEGLAQDVKELTATCTLPPVDKKSEPETRTTTLVLQGSNNPNEHIKDFVQQRDGFTRVHPKAFLAVLEAAVKTQVASLVITSNWRPIKGSIAHRAGLGLDVGALWAGDGAEILLNNREVLSQEGTATNALVSAKEKESYHAYLAAKEKAKAAEEKYGQDSAAASSATAAVRRARLELEAAKNVKKGSPPPDAALLEQRNKAIKQAQTDLDSATVTQKASSAAQDAARKELNGARSAWRTELEVDDPALMKSFRDALLAHPFVGQLFDPWYIDYTVGDKSAAQLNEQCDELSKVHNNHLHVTIAEPTLLNR